MRFTSAVLLRCVLPACLPLDRLRPRCNLFRLLVATAATQQNSRFFGFRGRRR